MYKKFFFSRIFITFLFLSAITNSIKPMFSQKNIAMKRYSFNQIIEEIITSIKNANINLNLNEKEQLFKNLQSFIIKIYNYSENDFSENIDNIYIIKADAEKFIFLYLEEFFKNSFK